MGSGSCGIACEELGFNYIGIEIDPTYFATAERRLDKKTPPERG
jgi:DNA modification methylase